MEINNPLCMLYPYPQTINIKQQIYMKKTYYKPITCNSYGDINTNINQRGWTMSQWEMNTTD